MTQGSERRRRTAHLTVRLTPEERKAIDAAAERAGLTAGSFARQSLLEGPIPRQVRRPPIERRELARLLGELGHIGGNINQLAHSSNTGQPVERREVANALAGLRDMRDAVLAALGRAP